MSEDNPKYNVLDSLLRNAVLGTGVGLGGAGLMELFKWYNDTQEDAEKNTTIDDNVVRVKRKSIARKVEDKRNAEQEKEASMWNEAAKYTGFLGSAAASYAIVRKLMQEMRKNDKQKELDQLQKSYTASLHDLKELEDLGYLDYVGYDPSEKTANLEKQASPGMSELGGGAITALLATLLATSAITPTVLDKYFPKTEKPKYEKKPKFIVEEEPEEENVDDAFDMSEVEEKTASVPEVTPKVVENLLRVIYNTKEASYSGFTDIINAVANDKSEIIKAAAFTGDLDLVFNSVKGEEKPKEQHKLAAAFIKVAHDSLLSNMITPLAAGEFLEQYPTLYGLGLSLDAGFKKQAATALEGVIDSIHQKEFKVLVDKDAGKEFPQVKSASALDFKYKIGEACDKIIKSASLEEVEL